MSLPGVIRIGGRSLLATAATVVIFLVLLLLPHPPITASANTQSQPAPPAVAPNPDAVCAGCHREIYQTYERTPMARGSGSAADGLLPGGFLHFPSGIRYNLFLRNGTAWISYYREAEPGNPVTSPLHGEQQLIYYIGSGHRGRTYLYEENGQWFEAPINYYSKKHLWDMAPNYGATKTLPTALPVDSNCLHCHATAVQRALPEARNKYDGPPFLQAGIGCAACHGDPSKHLAQPWGGSMINPAKLDPVRRDSVCLQCHLEGDVAIYHSGTSLAQFHPGDRLSNYVVYFVKDSAEPGGRRAVSQYEALLRSACKVASGDRMTCTTCHDPHSMPAPEERIGYYRNKCLSCHTGVAMATKHHPEQQDCAACHMPTRVTTDISHEQVTDHNIQARPATVSGLRLSDIEDSVELEPVSKEQVSDREYGLAYAQLAQHGNRKAGEKALDLLQKAEKGGAEDFEVHTQLGFLEQMRGDRANAVKEYSAALQENPYDATALGNLGVFYASSGHTADAARLLQRVIDADPSSMAAGLNLAFIECRIGDKKRALEILTGLSRINPDDPAIRTFLTAGTYGGERCDLH